MEREAHHRRRRRRHSKPDHPQANRHVSAFGRRLRLSDPLSVDSSRICCTNGKEWSGARQRKFPDDHERGSLAVAASHSAGREKGLKEQPAQSHLSYCETITPLPYNKKQCSNIPS